MLVNTSLPSTRGKLPPEILAPLRRFRWRVLRVRAAWRLGITTAAAVLLFGAALALDRFFLLSHAERFAVACATVGVATILTAWSALGLLRPLRWLELARGLEAEEPSLGEGLLSSVEIALASKSERERLSPQLTRALFETTADKLCGINVSTLVDARRARTAAWTAMACCAVLLGITTAWHEESRLLAARFLHPASDLPRPSTVVLEIAPGSIATARGSNIEVTARAIRGAPAEALLLVRSGDGPWTTERRAFEAGSLTRPFSALRRTMEYRVIAGDFASAAYRIDVREPPRPASFRITYRFPEYTGRPAQTVERSSGDISALAGTRADFEVTATERLVRAWIERTDGGPPRPLAVNGATASLDGLEVTSTGGFRLFLEATDGVTNEGRAQYLIRALPDRPPSIEIVEPRSVEVSAETSSIVAVRYDARDDVGVKSIDLVVRDDAKELKTAPVDVRAAAVRLDIGALSLKPGESASFFLRARDGLGQEARSSDRTLRIALLADPPEGAGWPGPLAEIEEALEAALADWSKILPAAGAEAPETFAADPAHAERLLQASERTLGTMTFLRRIGGAAVEAGRAIALPSPNRRALEDLGILLHHAADEECAAFWAEAALVAGSIRDGAAGPEASVPAVKLFAAHGAAWARLDETTALVKAIHRSERLEEAFERCLAIERGLAIERSLARKDRSDGSAPDPGRRRDLAREAGLLAAELTKLAGPGGTADESLESIARALLETEVPAIENSEPRGEESIVSIRSRLEERYEKAEKVAAAARARLEPQPVVEATLEKLAAAAERAEVLTLARSIIVRLSEELDAAESLEYADLDTTTDLSAMRELVERAAEEGLEAAPASAPDAARTDQAREVLEAYRATGPSRAVGRAVQEIDRIATAEEDLAWKLRSARTWNWNTLRHLARTQREISRALDPARDRVSRTRDAATAEQIVLRQGLDAALASIDRAKSSMEEVFRSLAGGAPQDAALQLADDAALQLAPATAGRAALALDGVTESLEALRASAMPEAAAARARLRARLGTIPERIALLAAAERAHSRRVKDLSLSADAPDAAGRAETLLLAHEENRRDAEGLASKTRREGDRLLAAGAGADRLRAYDRAAVQLAAAASTEMAEASRALRSGSGADSASRAGILLDASVKEEKTAGRLDAIARALAAIDADEALRISSREIEAALGSARPADAESPEAQDPAKIGRAARLSLDASLKAAETLASRAAKDPRFVPLLELLRAAAELFRQAIELAEKKEGPAAGSALAAGRARLEEAVALARKLRGESEGDLASARDALGGESRDEAAADEKKEMSRDLEAAYAELEKLIELERLEKELASRMEDLLREEKPDPGKLEELEKKERDLEKELGDRYLTGAELVELVSKLVGVDRDGREVSSLERSLAAEAEKAMSASGGGAQELKTLKPRQDEALSRARKLAKDFQTAGFKLSAVLPHVLRAYWKAGDAVEPLLAAMEAAASALEAGSAPQKALLDAAAKVDGFLAQVGEMRRQALEAIADQERGESGANAAQLGLERARRSMNEASRLRREGNNEAASRAQRSTLRSIADAAGALRARIAQVALPSGEEGFLMSRVLDEEAARLGLGWNVLTRGSHVPAAARLSQPGAEEMPFPARFREWVRVYLKAIEKR